MWLRPPQVYEMKNQFHVHSHVTFTSNDETLRHYNPQILLFNFYLSISGATKADDRYYLSYLILYK